MPEHFDSPRANATIQVPPGSAQHTNTTTEAVAIAVGADASTNCKPQSKPDGDTARQASLSESYKQNKQPQVPSVYQALLQKAAAEEAELDLATHAVYFSYDKLMQVLFDIPANFEDNADWSPLVRAIGEDDGFKKSFDEYVCNNCEISGLSLESSEREQSDDIVDMLNNAMVVLERCCEDHDATATDSLKASCQQGRMAQDGADTFFGLVENLKEAESTNVNRYKASSRCGFFIVVTISFTLRDLGPENDHPKPQVPRLEAASDRECKQGYIRCYFFTA